MSLRFMSGIVMSDRIVPLIMCGGAGTRLWPLSSEELPKQFISLFGQRSTFQETVLRVMDSRLFDRPVVVTGASYRSLVLAQLHEIGCQADILLESARRDSGPAIAAGTIFAATRDPQCVVLALAADHIVRDAAAFVEACEVSLKTSAAGYIVTFGVRPERPATEYGYISPGAAIDGPVCAVASFIEKPDSSTATRYIQDGYLWNSGNFMFRADILLEEYRAVDSGSIDSVVAAIDRATRDRNVISLRREEFERAASISIDYAVMEKTKRAAVLPVALGWSDVGSWHAVWELSAKDDEGNAVQGNAVLDSSRNCYVSSENVVVALAGVDDLAVVATGDVVLVSRQADATALKRLVAKFKNGRPHLANGDIPEVPIPGASCLIDAGDRCQVRRVVIGIGERLSLHQDRYRSEHWVVVQGTALIDGDGSRKIFQEGDSFFVAGGSSCWLENSGGGSLELIGMQTGLDVPLPNYINQR